MMSQNFPKGNNRSEMEPDYFDATDSRIFIDYWNFTFNNLEYVYREFYKRLVIGKIVMGSMHLLN